MLRSPVLYPSYTSTFSFFVSSTSSGGDTFPLDALRGLHAAATLLLLYIYVHLHTPTYSHHPNCLYMHVHRMYEFRPCALKIRAKDPQEVGTFLLFFQEARGINLLTLRVNPFCALSIS